MTLVFNRESKGSPGTHALIVASGDVPRHPDTGARATVAAGLRIADWLIGRFRNPGAELASVDILAAAHWGAKVEYLPPGGTTPAILEPPQFETLKSALEGWRDRLDSDPGNIAFFYYAGYVFRRPETLLVLQDFAGGIGSGTGAGVSFPSLLGAMMGCLADRHLYIVDGIPLHVGAAVQAMRPQMFDAPAPREPEAASWAVIYGETDPGRLESQAAFSDALLQILRPVNVRRPISVEDIVDRLPARLKGTGARLVTNQIDGSFDLQYPGLPRRPLAAGEPPRPRKAKARRGSASQDPPDPAGQEMVGAAPEASGSAPIDLLTDPAETTPPGAIEAEAATADEANTEFVLDDAEVERDALGRSALAIGLARRLHKIWRRTNEEAAPAAEGRAAFVVHLDAPWGGGKTSFANFLARVLNPSPRGGLPARFLREHYPETDLGGVFLGEPPPDREPADLLATLPPDARRPWVVVTFNAWQAEHCTPPWWVFYQAIRKDCFEAIRTEGDGAWVPRPPPVGPAWRTGLARRWRAYCASAEGKARWLYLVLREYVWRFFNPKILSVLLVGAVAAIVLLGLHLTIENFELAKWLGILSGALAGLWGLAAFFTESIAPGTASVAERFSLGVGDPFGRFRTHFAGMMARVRRPVMVVVDDLDRCRPDFVVDLVRGIQTLLRSPRVVFLILGDRDWIERAFESHHAAMREVDVGPEQSFGARFVEKAIQLSFILPTLGEDGRRDYVRRVLIGDPAPRRKPPRAQLRAQAVAVADADAAARGPSGETAPEAIADPAEEPGIGDGAESSEAAAAAAESVAGKADAAARVSAAVREIVNREATAPAVDPFDADPVVERVLDELVDRWFRDALPGRADNLFDPEVDVHWLNLIRHPAPIALMVGEALAIRATTDETVEREVTHELQRLAAHFPANPRQIKRIVNAITIYHAVALQRPEVTPDAAFRGQLALWVIIMTEWPRTWRLLASFPDLVDVLTSARPGSAIRKKGLALPGSIAATEKALAEIRSDGDLIALIAGAPGKGRAPLATSYVRILAELTPLHSRRRRLSAGADESSAPRARAKARRPATGSARAKRAPRSPRPGSSAGSG